MLSKEACCAVGLRIHHIHKRVCILRQTSCVDNQLVVLGKSSQKMVCSWPLQDKYITYAPLNVHRNDIVRFFHLFKLGMNQCFIKIQDQSFLSFEMLRLRS